MRRVRVRVWVMLGAVLAAVVAVPAGAQAPQTARDTTAMALRGGFKEVSEWITKAADLVPADKYGYRPIADVRSWGQLVAHVIDAYTWYCTNAKGTRLEWTDANEKGALDKATLVAKLKTATDLCTDA